MAQGTVIEASHTHGRLRRAVTNRLVRYFARDMRNHSGCDPLLTLSFDDVPKSAVTTGARILDRFNASATWFVCGGYEARQRSGDYYDRNDLVALMGAGHEIGCHGYGHIDYQFGTNTEVVLDLDRNAALFDEVGLPAPRSFAFPFGRASLSSKMLCGRRFDVCRGVTPGLSGKRIDANLMASVPLYSKASTFADTREWIDRLAATGGVLSLFSHGVTDQPTAFDCTPAHLADALAYGRALGIEVRTLCESVLLAFPAP